MKRNINKFIGIALISSLGFTACHKKSVTEEPGLALLLSLAIRNSASGNCAVSLNLATLYSGAIIQTAVNTVGTFTQADYEQCSSTTVGSGQTYTTYADVPYNVKYDAFIKGGGTYDATARATDTATAKASVDAGSVLGAAKATASGITAAGGAPCGAQNASLIAAVTGHINQFSAAEITALNPVLVALTAGAGGLNATTILGAGGLANAGVCAALIPNVTANDNSAVSGYQARQAYANGAAILACGRIPRSSCTFAALTTADRATAIKSAVTAVDNVANNADCRKTNSDFTNAMIRTSFFGVPKGTVISGFTSSPSVTASPTDGYIAISEGTTAPNNKIFAKSAYPISSALSTITTGFNVAFPMSVGTTKQTESTIPYYKASNISIAAVESCEALGFAGYGPSNGVTTNNATLALKKELTPAKEIAYAFSAENTAATLYAGVRGAVQDTANAAGSDAIACNNSFRSRFSIPLAIGGGKLSVLNNAVSGNGGATSTLTTCVYGGTSTSLTTSASLLSTTLAGIAACPTAAAAGAGKFGDTGLDTLANFPNN